MKREKLILLGFDLGREVRLRDRERDFGQKKPPSGVVVVMSQPCRFGLETWACFRGRSVGFLYLYFFLLIFFNKLCLVAWKGRKVNNGVTILLIDLLGLNLIMSYLSI